MHYRCFFFAWLQCFWIFVGLLRSSIEAPLIGLFLSAGVGGLLAASLVRWIFLLLIADPESPAPEQDLRVAVVTTFVPQAESLSMLERTVLAITQLELPARHLGVGRG